MTPMPARTARWTSVVILALVAFTVIALGLSMWWLAVLVALVVVLSFAFGRFEDGPDEAA